MSIVDINLKELDRRRLEELREAVEQEIENRRFEERLLWEVRRQSRGEAQAG
ncbi:hypothetical protein J2T57_002538 [Natronocella acetinitrilica]|jgi:hypothetical protein|uniref:Uncharacterized protein n=1 Tax=Natronocella acetinitrilica TaxID=414046 RepID=A0AAE3G6Q2_9GAMM|nr:hypothetical protein [Natronocella acetinitrilica]MCP1675388.1 hypothetical protein [Natronocella acetinitrilica]